MENRVKQMETAGIISPDQDSIVQSPIANSADQSETFTFSGYGRYTPIKVSSRTSLINADME